MPTDMLATARYVLQRERRNKVVSERASQRESVCVVLCFWRVQTGMKSNPQHSLPSQPSPATAAGKPPPHGDDEGTTQGDEVDAAHEAARLRLLRALRDGRALTPALLSSAGLRPLSPLPSSRAVGADEEEEDGEEDDEEEGEEEEE